jgi:F-type H+-transporting ATPase subunit delta
MALQGSIARRYARALLEIGVAQKTFEKMGRDLQGIADLFLSSKDLRHALENPIFPLSQRKKVLETLCERLGITGPLRSFLMLVMDRGRIAQIPDMARELAALVDRQAGRVRATLLSAQPLPEAFVQKIQGAMEKRLAKQVILERRQDATLLGGVVAKVGDMLYDGSLRTQLELARQQLLSE